MSTIIDVARKAGVSKSTVSRVLTGGPVSPETKARVLEAMRALNYQPNVTARGLVGKGSRLIGVLVSDVMDPYYSELMRGMEDGALSRQYDLIIYSTRWEPERELASSETGMRTSWCRALFGIALVVAVAAAAGAQEGAAVNITFGGVNRVTDDMVIEMFNEAYAGKIHVTGTGMNLDSLKVATVGGSPPEVALVDRFRVAELAASGFLQPLDELIARDGLDPAGFFPPTWEECVFNGKVYCIPRSTDTRVMWYNKTMLEQFGFDGNTPPATWEEVLSYSRKMTTSDGQQLQTVGLIPTAGNWFFQGWLWAAGGDLLDETLTTVTWAGPEGRQVMAWAQEMVDLYGGFAAIRDFNARFGGNPIVRGVQAFEMNVFNYWENRLKDVTEYEWGAANPPRPAGLESTPVSWSGGYGLAIPAGARNVDAAWEFIKFFVTPEAQVVVSMTDIPVVAGVATLPEVPDQTPFMRKFLELMPYSRYRPPVPVGAQLYTIYRTEIFNRFQAGEPPEEILIDTAQRAQKILDDGWAAYHGQ